VNIDHIPRSVTNESWTCNCEATCQGPIGLAETATSSQTH